MWPGKAWATCAVLTFLLIGFLVAHYVRLRALAMGPQKPDLRDRLATYNTGGKVPGDPSKAIRDLSKVHVGLAVFSSRHHRYPRDAAEFVKDVFTRAKAYPFKVSDLKNPDSQYAASPVARRYPDRFFPFLIPSKRPDGTGVGGKHRPGTRDVLAYTNIYAHHNITHRRREGDLLEPVGFFIVLWDDGTIEKIPLDRLIYVHKGNGSYAHGFPGQAGVPPGSRSYWEFHGDYTRR